MTGIRRDEFSALEPIALGTVRVGDEAGGTAQTVTVRPLKVGQIPAFARAVRPVSDQVQAMLAGGLDVAGVMQLLEQHTEQVIEALAVASGARQDALRDSTIEQIGELLLAVLAANRDFLRGRLTAAIRTAAAASSGAGQTPSQP